jgi:hypothetical protein
MLAYFVVLHVVRKGEDGQPREDFAGDYSNEVDAHRDGAAVCRADATAVTYVVKKSYL